MRRRSACLVAAVAAANALRSSFTATPPPCDPRTGAALLPFDRQGATSWEGARRRFLSRRPRAPDPGRPEALDWLDADLEGVEAIYDADGSGEIEWDEFLNIMHDMTQGSFLDRVTGRAGSASPRPHGVIPTECFVA